MSTASTPSLESILDVTSDLEIVDWDFTDGFHDREFVGGWDGVVEDHACRDGLGLFEVAANGRGSGYFAQWCTVGVDNWAMTEEGSFGDAIEDHAFDEITFDISRARTRTETSWSLGNGDGGLTSLEAKKGRVDSGFCNVLDVRFGSRSGINSQSSGGDSGDREFRGNHI